MRLKEIMTVGSQDLILLISFGLEQPVKDTMMITTGATGLGIMPALRSLGLTGQKESPMTTTSRDALPS